MKSILFTWFILIVSTFSNESFSKYNVRIDARFGYKSYSIFINEKGSMYVIKGKSSYFTQKLQYKSYAKSTLTAIKDAHEFYQKLETLNTHRVISSKVNTDAIRVELYYHGQKIYDDSPDAKFWKLFNQITPKLPDGYCPFCPGQKPF